MTLLDALQSSLPLLYSVCFILGLFVGSFLNVVVYRLPLMMEAGWRRECHEFLELEQTTSGGTQPFNLMVPRSACPQCKSLISAWQNIPVISWLLLRGKCANCKNPISAQYPLVELLTGILSLVVAIKFGASLQTCFALVFTWSLITLALIDFHTTLLPDSITLPLMWLGLMLSLSAVFIDTHQALIGAAAGYLILWCVFQAFKLITGKEGMGFGDFKLLAALGAWLGWAKLPLIILLSSLAGAVIGITMMVAFKHSREKPIPFGPYLAIAGWIALIWGDTLVRLYNAQMGL
ncbi:methyltransferase [Chromatiales bacterium (ex Bugula neritina AB1)]|nr:methyltransferase [Chromatiales bacterium (ex Bugula neritina AB1)]